MKMRILSLLISFVLLAILIYLSDVRKIIDILKDANFFYVFLGLGLFFFDMILRAFRWNYLLREVKLNLPFYRILKIFIPGQFFSNLSPGKVGDPVRNILLKKVEGKSIGVSFPSILFERIFDISIMSILSIMGIFIFSSTIRSIWLVLSILVYIFVFGAAYFILFSKSRTQKVLLKIFSIFSFIKKIKKYKNRMIRFSSNLHESFIKYNNKKTIFVITIFTTVIWILNGVLFFIAFKTFGIDVSLISTITIIPLATLASILTFLPSGIGSSEAIMAYFFISLFSLTLAQVLVASLLLRFYYILLYGVLSAIIIPNLKYNYKI